MPKYDFACERGHRFEAECGRDFHATTCFCGATAERLLSVPAAIVGPRGLIPKSQRSYSLREYTEASQQVEHEFERYKDETQQETLQPPDLWNPARKAANAVLAGKRKPPKDWTPVDFTR